VAGCWGGAAWNCSPLLCFVLAIVPAHLRSGRFSATSDAKTWPSIMLNHAALIVMPHELAALLNHLHEGDIVCLVHVDSKIAAWVGDEKAGPFAHASFATGETRRAVLWLHRTAIRLFPGSRYARRWPARFSPLALLAGLWRPF
jgi:hypothetical protein